MNGLTYQRCCLNSRLLFIAFTVFSPKLMAAETTTTKVGKVFTLEAPSNIFSTATDRFSICSSDVELLKKIKLWMPEHGHGSTPVKIGSVNDGCREGTLVNFTMPGVWEVRLELSDGDSGQFSVDVQ